MQNVVLMTRMSVQNVFTSLPADKPQAVKVLKIFTDSDDNKRAAVNFYVKQFLL